MAEKNTEKLEARPVQRIVSLKDGKVLGYRYQWNDGSFQDLWFGGPNDAEHACEDIRDSCTSSASKSPVDEA